MKGEEIIQQAKKKLSLFNIIICCLPGKVGGVSADRYVYFIRIRKLVIFKFEIMKTGSYM